MLDCGASDGVPQDVTIPPGVLSVAGLQLVMREVSDCQLVIPDAIRYNDTNGIVWPLNKDQALVVSDEGPLVPGSDYELVDGVITFTADACSRANLTSYVCKDSCQPPVGDEPGPDTCQDIQDAPGYL